MTLSVTQMMITQLPFRLNIIVSTCHYNFIILHRAGCCQLFSVWNRSQHFSSFLWFHHCKFNTYLCYPVCVRVKRLSLYVCHQKTCMNVYCLYRGIFSSVLYLVHFVIVYVQYTLPWQHSKQNMFDSITWDYSINNSNYSFTINILMPFDSPRHLWCRYKCEMSCNCMAKPIPVSTTKTLLFLSWLPVDML